MWERRGKKDFRGAVSTPAPLPSSALLDFSHPQSTAVQSDYTGNSRNKEFVRFKLHALLSTAVTSCAMPLRPTQDAGHPVTPVTPLVQHLLPARAPCSVGLQAATPGTGQPVTARHGAAGLCSRRPHFPPSRPQSTGAVAPATWVRRRDAVKGLRRVKRGAQAGKPAHTGLSTSRGFRPPLGSGDITPEDKGEG